MSEPLTPERRAEIEAYSPFCSSPWSGMAKELLAEIDRLNKVVDQAVGAGLMEARPADEGRVARVDISANTVAASKYPELAAELQRRGK